MQRRRSVSGNGALLARQLPDECLVLKIELVSVMFMTVIPVGFLS